MVKGKKYRVFVILTLLLAVLLLGSCDFIHELLPGNADADIIDPYYIVGSSETKAEFRELFQLLADEQHSAENEFAVVREIAASYARLRDYDRLIHFLSARAISYPSDPYNGYYLLMVAYAYIQLDAYPIAARYFDLIVKNYPDLSINNESIHLVCLRQLIELNDSPEQQVWYYQELIRRFSDQIDLGITYFMLGQVCERVGDWNGAIEAYIQYLPYTGTMVPGFPNADYHARQLVDFSRSPKDWTFENLPALVQAVQGALEEGSATRLRRYQAKVNFFARSWEQWENDDSGMVEINLAAFMYSSKIRYAASVDAASNATEAYLRTWGWPQYIPTWYFYFRKIYFPSDPEIHGRWEWAGIFYGEKF